MANQLQKIDQLELFFADLVTELTGLPEEHVLLQFPQDGQPFSRINQDVIYVECSQVESEIHSFMNRDMKYNPITKMFDEKQQNTRIMDCHMIFYGPNSSEIAELLYHQMFFPSTKITLDQNNLFVIPKNTSGPTKIYEQLAGRWWHRCDLTFQFYNPVIIEDQIPAFERANIKLEVDT